MAYDSSILDPGDINVAVAGDRVRCFGVNFANYSGAYACVLELSAYAALLFAEALDCRVRRGSNGSHTYSFFAMRRSIADPEAILTPFDFARYRWEEIDDRAVTRRHRDIGGKPAGNRVAPSGAAPERRQFPERRGCYRRPSKNRIITITSMTPTIPLGA